MFPKKKQNNFDQKAQILEAALSISGGVRDLVRLLKWKTSKVITLLREMNRERLIDMCEVNNSKRGRPKKVIYCTPLGLEFLKIYKKLKLQPIRASKEDLNRAIKDALYTERLLGYGHSPFQLFMELNTFVRNIKGSPEASETF
ncbi:MAG: hypothetical protein ACTSYB_08380 [Candidatus Helarchaeota archaeon]